MDVAIVVGEGPPPGGNTARAAPTITTHNPTTRTRRNTRRITRPHLSTRSADQMPRPEWITQTRKPEAYGTNTLTARDHRQYARLTKARIGADEEVGVDQLPVSRRRFMCSGMAFMIRIWTRRRSALFNQRPTLQAGYGTNHIRSLAARWSGQVDGSGADPPTPTAWREQATRTQKHATAWLPAI